MKVEDPDELVRAAEAVAWATSPRAGNLLAHLDGLTSVSLRDDVPTARIRRVGATYAIEFGRSFVETHLESARDLCLVVCHELMHKLKGDLFRPNGDDPLDALTDNITADIQINAHLLNTLFPEGVGLFDRLYGERGGGVANLLLLPPNRLLARSDEPEARGVTTLLDVAAKVSQRTLDRVAAAAFREEGAAAPRARALAAWYRRAWLTSEASHPRLKARLRQLLEEDAKVLFLGDHDPQEQGGRDPSGRPGNGAGYNEELVEERVTLDAPGDELAELSRRVRSILEPSVRASRSPRALAVERSPRPGLGRRSGFLLAAGQWPVLFEDPYAGRTDEEARAQVYVDVSGSMADVTALVYGLLTELARDELIAEPVMLFSNAVAPVSLEEIRAGRVVTTGGTDFDCIAADALGKRARRVLVITDGEAGISPANVQALRRAQIEVYVLYTVPWPGNSPLEAVARERWSIPRISGEVAGRRRRAR